jgi:hypothetical protein
MCLHVYMLCLCLCWARSDQLVFSPQLVWKSRILDACKTPEVFCFCCTYPWSRSELKPFIVFLYPSSWILQHADIILLEGVGEGERQTWNANHSKYWSSHPILSWCFSLVPLATQPSTCPACLTVRILCLPPPLLTPGTVLPLSFSLSLPLTFSSTLLLAHKFQHLSRKCFPYIQQDFFVYKYTDTFE